MAADGPTLHSNVVFSYFYFLATNTLEIVPRSIKISRGVRFTDIEMPWTLVKLFWWVHTCRMLKHRLELWSLSLQLYYTTIPTTS